MLNMGSLAKTRAFTDLKDFMKLQTQKSQQENNGKVSRFLSMASILMMEYWMIIYNAIGVLSVCITTQSVLTIFLRLY